MKTLVWAVVTYGCESWTIKIRNEERIEAFELKCIRTILRVSWTQKKTNGWVLEAAGVERDLLNLIEWRKLSYFGHMMRKEGDCLEKQIMEGTVPGVRKQGRPKMRWIDEMEKMEKWAMRYKMSFEGLLRETEDRRRWRRLVHEATNPRNEDG